VLGQERLTTRHLQPDTRLSFDVLVQAVARARPW
jgi:hypothetical protein